MCDTIAAAIEAHKAACERQNNPPAGVSRLQLIYDFQTTAVSHAAVEWARSALRHGGLGRDIMRGRRNLPLGLMPVSMPADLVAEYVARGHEVIHMDETWRVLASPAVMRLAR